MKLFKNHLDALNKLLNIMPIGEMKKERWEVLSISKSGYILAQGVAKAIGANKDYLFNEPIYAPENKECAIAVVSETEEIVINEHLIDAFDISLDYIYGEAKRKYEEKILSYQYRFRKGEGLSDLAHKNVLLVDEGADTGLTLMVALKTVFAMKPKRVAVALPVVPESLVDELKKLVDNLYVIEHIEHYIDAKSYFEQYETFNYEFCQI